MTGRHEQAPRCATSPDNPCVWMSAGLLAYRLCDRQYDCEHCPLDAALRRADLEPPIRHPAGLESQDPRAGTSLEYREDRNYGRGHCWVQERDSGRLRLGLDAFAAALLAPLVGVIFPTPGTRLARGEAVCWLRMGTRPVPLPAPASGSLERVNPRIRRDPALACLAPYDAGWLVELQPDGTAAAPGLEDANRARRRATADQRHLDHLVASERQGGSGVGATLPDGGSPVVNLRDMLGSARFARLVRRLLR